MAERLKPVDVVTVGVGMTGGIMGKELAAAGLKVVGLERGPMRDTVPDFQSPAIHDELRFAVRKAQGMSPVPGSVGEFFWGGATGTYFWIDPANGIAGVILMQYLPFADAKALAVYDAFERGTYQLVSATR